MSHITVLEHQNFAVALDALTSQLVEDEALKPVRDESGIVISTKPGNIDNFVKGTLKFLANYQNLTNENRITLVCAYYLSVDILSVGQSNQILQSINDQHWGGCAFIDKYGRLQCKP